MEAELAGSQAFEGWMSTRKNVDEVTAISDHEVTEASEDGRTDGRTDGDGRTGMSRSRLSRVDRGGGPEWATDSEIAPSSASVRRRQDCLG